MRGLFINELGACNIAPFKIKCIEPVTMAAIIGAGASVLNAGINSASAANMNQASRDYDWFKTQDLMFFNDEQAEKARQGQRELLESEQNWNEKMYNLYNSPSAMMRQYQEAGMNPYLVDAQSSHGQSLGSPSAPSAPQASAPSTGQPSWFMPDLSGIGRAGEMVLQAIGVSANAANQSAQGIHQVLENAIMMEKMNIPKDDIQKYLYTSFKEIKGANFDASRFVREYDLKIESQELANAMQNMENVVYREFGRTEKADKIMNMEKEFEVMAGQLGLMATQGRLNDAMVDEIAQKIKTLVSEAGLNEANSELLWRSMDYLVKSAKYQAKIDKFNSLTSEGEYGIREGIYSAASSDAGQAAELIDYYGGKIVDKAGKLMKINIGVNHSRSTTSSRNYTNSWIWNGRDYTP